MTFIAKFRINKSEALKASFKVNEQNHVKAVFKADFRPSKVSQLKNDLEFQTKQEVDTAIQTESAIINEKIDTEVERLDDRIDNIEEDLDGTITSITGDDLINVIRNDRSVQLHSTTFVFEQGIASTTWDIVHNLNKRPNVVLVDSSGRQFEAPKDYIDDNHIVVTLQSATTGKAYLN